MSVKRKGACACLAVLMMTAVLSAGAITVHAEEEDPDYEDPGTTYSEPEYSEPDYTDPEPGEDDPGTYDDPDDSTGDDGDTDTGDGDDYDPYTSTDDTDTGSGDGDGDGSTDTYYNPDYNSDYPDYYTPETVYDNDWGSDFSWSQDYELNQDTATSGIDTDTSVDTSELTSDDWEELQRSLAQNNQTGKANVDALDFAEVKKNRDDGTLSNDNWIFLAIGIPMLILGTGLVATVIIVSIRAAQAAKAEEMIDMHTAPARKAPAVRSSDPGAPAEKQLKKPAAPGSKADLGDTLTKPLKIDIKGIREQNKNK